MKSSRIERLRELVEASGGPTGFVRTYNRKDGDKPLNESYVSQILNGHRPFGEKSARNMEKRAGLPPGYFDQEIEAPKPEELRRLRGVREGERPHRCRWGTGPVQPFQRPLWTP